MITLSALSSSPIGVLCGGFSVIIILHSQFSILNIPLNPLDIVTTVLGLAYILFEYRASAWMWAVGFVMQSLGIVLYYQKGLYADCGMEFYYLTMTVYGFWKWAYSSPKLGEVRRGLNSAHSAQSSAASAGKVLRLRDISNHDDPRIDMHDEELNRVLGGGLVPGSIVLLGGEPGIGKSTLSLQTMLHMPEKKILYVSGEESAHQLKMRANRLGGENDNFLILTENSLEAIFDHIKDEQPELVVIDSIQTIMTEDVESSAGSIAQVRECASALLRFAKASGVPVILIGHITKEGTLAGPKILEHIVDTVIQFEGDQHYMYRILRSMKNRFGSTSELGIYEMQQNGLRQVSNPSELLLTQDHEGLSGIAISSAAYGTPQRSATGFDQRRLNMLLAVLEKRVGFKLMQKDVFINIAGGLRVTDLAMDLSVIAAVLSSNVDTPIESGWCMAGEVGLSGEVRPVNRIEQRIAEAEKLGFTDMIIPKYNLKGLDNKKYHITLHPVRKVEEALRELFG